MTETAFHTPPSPRSPYLALIHRLSESSVNKHFDAYEDVSWNHPDYWIHAEDPRWEKGLDDVLGATEWYRSQPASIRARLGLHHIVFQMRLGVEFESILSRGLLEFSSTLPSGTPEFRYALHEVIEEGQHSLMFQEFINRAQLPVRGLTGFDAFSSRFVPGLGRTFPELFFLFVLGGEVPIDFTQRRELRHDANLHPLLKRVMQIHVTEEARHLCFAKRFMAENVPKLGPWRRWQLKVRAPFILGAMSAQMLKPPSDLIRAYGIPKEVVREAYTHNPVHRKRVLESLAPVRRLCESTGLVTPGFRKLWQALGIAPESEPHTEEPPRHVIECSVPGIIRAVPRQWTRPIDTQD